MKKAKKIISVVLCMVMVFAPMMLGVTAFAYSGKEHEISKTKNFLVLGDSIAEGYGLENTTEAAYGKIVADTEGYNYRNLAQVANDTSDLIGKINGREDFRESIAWADIINICIGSNNYLANPDVVGITIGALLRVNAKQLDEIADWIYADYLVIYDLIRELNPDATIIINNIYCAWQGLGHIPFIQAVERINAQIDKLKAAHDDVIIFDASSVITHKNELIAEDCVHPNAKGNIELARAFLALLKELNLGDKTEPVVLTPGIDYNFYQKKFGFALGSVIWIIVKTLTKNF